ncbi:hypothetical protein ACKWRH_23480 [Bradyrhizobium sp. Pa8]|uniref:helix-turn-helix domain-containing protein n=1 Tax=Bradyrhizobium sp. Pa8 TaxID=3386552 RepID=UPI00403FB1BA
MARMMVTCFTAMQKQYGHKHLGAVAITLLVGMTIRSNDADGTRSTIIGIARQLNVPRTSVRRSILELVRQGIIMAEGESGFTNNDDYFAGRLDADCAVDIPTAILNAAADLNRLLGNGKAQ